MSKLLNVSEEQKQKILEMHFSNKKQINEALKDMGDGKQFEMNEGYVGLVGMKKSLVQRALRDFPITVKYITIVDCEGADFSDVSLCDEAPFLISINVKGTPNNFDETQGDCFTKFTGGLYERNG